VDGLGDLTTSSLDDGPAREFDFLRNWSSRRRA
jgi:hypothetical protein